METSSPYHQGEPARTLRPRVKTCRGDLHAQARTLLPLHQHHLLPKFINAPGRMDGRLPVAASRNFTIWRSARICSKP